MVLPSMESQISESEVSEESTLPKGEDGGAFVYLGMRRI